MEAEYYNEGEKNKLYRIKIDIPSGEIIVLKKQNHRYTERLFLTQNAHFCALPSLSPFPNGIAYYGIEGSPYGLPFVSLE